MTRKKDVQEIVSLSGELMDFDVEDLNVEQLDRRLELAIAHLGGLETIWTCDLNCGNYCFQWTCYSNCGMYHPIIQT